MSPRTETKWLVFMIIVVVISTAAVGIRVWWAHSQYLASEAKKSEESLLDARHIAVELVVALSNEIIPCPCHRVPLADLRPRDDSPRGLNRSELKPDTDVWGHPWVVTCCDGTLEVRSAGRDGVLDTEDDTVDELRASGKSTYP